MDGPRAENGVIKHTLHAVAVLSVLGDAQQVASDFEMAVGAARGFEAGMTVRQTVAQLSGTRLSESLIGSPAACREALGFYEHLEAILGRVQMHLAPECYVGLHRRTEGVHMAVGVLKRQHVAALGQWTEVGIVLEVLLG